MLIPQPAKFRRQRGRVEYKNAENPAPPAALTLVSASYDESGPSVTLGFDRAVNVDGFDGSQIVVEDQPNAWKLVGFAAELLDAVTVRVWLTQIDTAELLDAVTVRVWLTQIDTADGTKVLLDATAATGIVAVDDGGTWSGVNEVELPFGS